VEEANFVDFQDISISNSSAKPLGELIAGLSRNTVGATYLPEVG
jgi:hypothetical protein